ncbi:MAG TPA: flavin reductase family protein [Bacillota bacterium]
MTIDPKTFRQVLGHFATGITVVTTRDAGGEPRGLTVNAFTSVSLDPPLVLFSLDRNSTTAPAFEVADAFAINILRADQRPVAERFAQTGGDKFTVGQWRSGKTGVPVLADALACIECTKWQVYDGGDHLLYLGRVEELWAGPGDPLLFFRGRILTLPSSGD